MKRTCVDERAECHHGPAAACCLVLTQIALVGVMLYKRLVLGLPRAAYTEYLWIAGLSVAGYWAIRLYLSGLLPVISFRKMLAVYGVSVAIIAVPTYLIHGWPVRERWYEVLYPFIGVAVICGLYALVAYFGKRRIGRLTAS
jgi:hypothetical protein